MDELEKKVRENFQARKIEDEKMTPAFDALMNRQRPLKYQARRHPNFGFKMAACIVGVMLALSYYFFVSIRHIKQTPERQTIFARTDLPSESLLKGNAENEYLWHWKSSTDHLVEDARQLTKSKAQKNKGI
jgi:hypothetical protein